MHIHMHSLTHTHTHTHSKHSRRSRSRSKSPRRRSRSPRRRRSRSRSKSPRRRSRSPRRRSRSPRRRSRSPRNRSRSQSPRHRHRSPSPHRRSSSPELTTEVPSMWLYVLIICNVFAFFKFILLLLLIYKQAFRISLKFSPHYAIVCNPCTGTWCTYRCMHATITQLHAPWPSRLFHRRGLQGENEFTVFYWTKESGRWEKNEFVVWWLWPY